MLWHLDVAVPKPKSVVNICGMMLADLVLGWYFWVEKVVDCYFYKYFYMRATYHQPQATPFWHLLLLYV